MKCNMDCFNCIFPDCVNDKVYPESNLYKNRPEEQKQYQKEYARKKDKKQKKKVSALFVEKSLQQKGLNAMNAF